MMKSKGRKVLVVISVVLVLLIVADWALSVFIYDQNFDVRFTTGDSYLLKVEEFEGLSREKYEFTSDKGQKLTGYMYSSGDDEKKGIIVLAHGFGGGGHCSYISCIDQLAKHGYLVFAYDATACDESEGEKVGGLPQGVIDLDNAISFVEENEAFPKLPIMLFGHSWGGYSVCTVLKYHPEVKAVVACSGFDSSTDLIQSAGSEMIGPGIYVMMPFLKLHERMRFGERANDTAMEGFAASDAAVMILHSEDDTVVPIQYGYDKYYEQYDSDNRFTFVRYEDRGHTVFADQTTEYSNRNVDTELFNSIAEFYDSHLN